MKNKRKFNLMTFKRFLSKNKFPIISCLILLLVGAFLLPKAFAQPVKSVEIIYDSVSFEEKAPGAWKVDKSAKWVGKGEAEITFNVDTVMKTNNKYTDVLFVLDVSGSMDGDKLNRVKADSIELIESLLSNGENKAGLITFDSTSNIVLDFTKDKELLKENINSLTTTGCTNYYQALVNVDEVLKNYKKEKDRECVVLFLTDGYPNEDTPNEEAQYSYLRQQYPFITINGIQYEMGTNVLEPVKKVSDNQFIADMDTLNNVLFDASVTPITYDEFSITDYIDTNYFYVEDESNIKVSQGKVQFDKANQKVTWTINEFKSGSKSKMTIKVKLKDEFINKGGFYPTNIKEEIKSKLGNIEENVESDKTPVLSDNYKVIYDGNVPAGCNVKGVPETRNHSVFDIVGISDASLKCAGYQFRGWEIVTDSARWINDDYFTMPEEDVVIRAKWGKLSIDKSMDGEVHEYIPATLERYTYNSTYGLHKYKSSITDIVFQDTMSKIGGAIDVLDISAERNNGILAYIVPNEDDSTKYTAYIQGDGSVIANSNSKYLFKDFSNLKSIQNLEYFDTSGVTDMRSMFYDCRSLIDLDLSSFDTSSAIYMSEMFRDCSSLTSLNLSKFNTSKVISMSAMFYDCRGLTNHDLSNFDTSKVNQMNDMFSGCSSLISLDLSNFDTSKVTDMSSMFSRCSSLTNLDLNSFDTSKAITISYMFNGCSSLASLDLGNFNTSCVTTMYRMFYECNSLLNLDLSNFDTSNVTTISYAFYDCNSLTSLDLSSFDTSKVTDMSFIFYGCYKLTNLNLINFDTSSVKNMSSMFYICSSLHSLNLSSFNTSNVINMSSMFCGCNGLSDLNLGNFDTSNVINMSSMFKGCSGLISLDLSNFDTSNVTTMVSMFERCRGLTNLDLSNFNTKSVTIMSNMFNDCICLTSLDFSSFDTLKVTDMSYMFSDCGSLTSLNLSNFKTGNVTNMASMFFGCYGLTDLNISYFDTSTVKNMYNMFYDCHSLQSLNLSSFNTSNVTNMTNMFWECSNLTTLDLSNFDTSKLNNMNYMFYNCENLSSLDLSNFDTSNVTTMVGMFMGCTGMLTLDLSNFDTSKLENMNYMFDNCKNLSSLDLSSFNTSKVFGMSNLFSDCNKLKDLDLSNFDTAKVKYMDSMFDNCYSMITIITIGSKLTSYSSIFKGAATAEGAQITVNYTENTAEVIDSYIGTKSSNSNVVKGELVTIGT